MARILHLEDDCRIRKKVLKLLGDAGHEVVSCSSISEVPNGGLFDLYICGPLGKYSDGLSFATDRRAEGKRVIILAHRRKFSMVPFIGLADLRNKKLALWTLGQALVGD